MSAAAPPCDPDALKEEALGWARRGRIRRSTELLEVAAAAAPQRVDLALRLGQARLELGDVPGALSAYQAALAMDPDPETLRREALEPLDDLLSRRSTFGNARKARNALAEGKLPKLRARQRTPAGPA